MTEWDMFGHQSLRNAFTLPKVNSKQPIIQSGLIQKYVYESPSHSKKEMSI